MALSIVRAVEIAPADGVRILLATRDEYLYPPGVSRLGATAGPAPGRTVPCSLCARRGRVVRAGVRRLCPLCEGTGWRRRRSGDPFWDEYTAEVVESSGGGQNHVEVGRSKRPKKAHGDSQQERLPDGARERHWRSGSYEELELALRGLRDLSPGLYALVTGQEGRNPSPAVRAWQEVIQGILAAMMRGPIFVPAEAIEGAWRERKRTIARRVRAGEALGGVARAEKVGYQQARRAVRRGL